MNKSRFVRAILFASIWAVAVTLGQNCSRANFEQAYDERVTKLSPGNRSDGGDPLEDTVDEDFGDQASQPPAGNPPGKVPPSNDPPKPIPPVVEPPVMPRTAVAVNCDAMVLKDIVLSVSGIQAGTGSHAVTAKSALTKIHLVDLQNGIPIMFPKAVDVSQIRIVLNSEGNEIIDSADVRHDLRTPSADQSGLKLFISNATQLDAGKLYMIKGEFNASRQLKANPQGCMLMPTWKDVSLI